MFQFRAFPSYAYLIQRTIRRYCLRGFPHSEISGSTDICSSPKLIAACHVLRRLLIPRHSPCALYSLTLRDILVLLLELCRQSTGYFRKIVIVTHIFSDVPQLKFTTFLQLPLKPSVALLSSHFNTLFSFQGAISSTQAPYHSPHRKRYVLFTSLCLLFLDKRFAGLSSEFGFDVLVLKPDLKIQSLGS